MKKTVSFVFLLFLSASASMADVLPNAKQLLSEMCSAMKNESYQGTFVYMHDNKVESMEIYRRKDGDGEKEKIVSLNGEAREILRDSTGIRCVLPKSRQVTVDKSRESASLPVSLPENVEKLSQFYHLSVDGEDRIAGMDSYIVSMTPKDGYRYGHRMWVDKGSRLMLKSDLLDEHGVSVEQIMFTSLSPNANISDDTFKVAAGVDYQYIESTPQAVEAEGQNEWSVSSMPAGFSVSSHTRKMQQDSEMEHMVLSDGMATVSVFVEPIKQSEKFLQGPSRIGAVNAYGTAHNNHKITVVGEVPAATVMQISQKVRPIEF